MPHTKKGPPIGTDHDAAADDSRSGRTGISGTTILLIAKSFQPQDDGSIPRDNIVPFVRDVLRELSPSSMK